MWLCNLHLDGERDGAGPSTASMRGKKLPSVVFWNWIECIYVVFRKSVLFREVMANMLLDLYINLLATKEYKTYDLNMIRFDMHIFIQLSWVVQPPRRTSCILQRHLFLCYYYPRLRMWGGFLRSGISGFMTHHAIQKTEKMAIRKKWKTSHEKSNLYRCFLLQSHLIVGLYCIVLQFSIKIHIDQSWNDIPIIFSCLIEKNNYTTTCRTRILKKKIPQGLWLSRMHQRGWATWGMWVMAVTQQIKARGNGMEIWKIIDIIMIISSNMRDDVINIIVVIITIIIIIIIIRVSRVELSGSDSISLLKVARWPDNFDKVPQKAVMFFGQWFVICKLAV